MADQLFSGKGTATMLPLANAAILLLGSANIWLSGVVSGAKLMYDANI